MEPYSPFPLSDPPYPNAPNPDDPDAAIDPDPLFTQGGWRALTLSEQAFLDSDDSETDTPIPSPPPIRIALKTDNQRGEHRTDEQIQA